MRKSKQEKLDRELRPWLKHYGDVPANLKYPDFAMVDMVMESAEKWPNNMAYSYYGGKVTYREFVEKIRVAARALKSYGVKIHKKLWELGVYANLFPTSTSYEDGAKLFIAKIEELNKLMKSYLIF